MLLNKTVDLRYIRKEGDAEKSALNSTKKSFHAPVQKQYTPPLHCV